ncbi:MAG: type II toxin-antitoxin system YoeB family toxin [Gemmatimonadaceae bacterium]
MPSKKRRAAVIQDERREDLRYSVITNRKAALRMLDPMEAVLRHSHAGIWKPERLKQLGGNVSPRLVNEADPLAYEVFDDRVEFLQARYHS